MSRDQKLCVSCGEPHRGTYDRCTGCYREALSGAVGDHEPEDVSTVRVRAAVELFGDDDFPASWGRSR